MQNIKYVNLGENKCQPHEMYVDFNSSDHLGLGTDHHHALYDLYKKIKAMQKETTAILKALESGDITIVDYLSNQPIERFYYKKDNGYTAEYNASELLLKFKELKDANKFDPNTLIGKKAKTIAPVKAITGKKLMLSGEIVSWDPMFNTFELKVTDLYICFEEAKELSAVSFKNIMTDGFYVSVNMEDIEVI